MTTITEKPLENHVMNHDKCLIILWSDSHNKDKSEIIFLVINPQIEHWFKILADMDRVDGKKPQNFQRSF